MVMNLTISGLVHCYADAACRRDRDAWSSCWADDGVWVLDAERRPEGREAIVRQWTTEMRKYAAVVQMVTNGDATEDGDGAAGRWYIQEYGRRVDGTTGLLLAYYDDTYRRVDGGWLFTRRELTRLYQGPPDFSGPFFLGASGAGQ
jgi:hypothetical protein